MSIDPSPGARRPISTSIAAACRRVVREPPRHRGRSGPCRAILTAKNLPNTTACSSESEPMHGPSRFKSKEVLLLMSR